MNRQDQPLADRIRPETLDEFIGQTHLVGAGKPLYQIVQTGNLRSMIFWGPPGVGKTTLARLIAAHTGREFVQLSAVSAGKNDMRQVVSQAKPDLTPMERMMAGDTASPGVLLFLDEIHRFNKAQQDFLLPYVEDGTIILIGATTENPSFEIIPALLSRAQVFMLEPFAEDEIKTIVRRGVAELDIELGYEALDFLASYANGDGRQALNLLDATAGLYTSEQQRELTIEHLKNALQSRHLRYDKASEEHYNTISAYIKSMRASNTNAALYYLARMVHAGEDPKFIARRMVIFASEDVGLATPDALPVANAVFRAVETVGYPECQINLAHGTAFLARASKSRSAYAAYFRALDDVKQHGNLPIPLKLRNAPTDFMKSIGYGDDYQMYDDPDLLPEKLRRKNYFPDSS